MYDGAGYYLPEGVYDPVLYGPMTLIATEPYFPDFDVSKLPWSKAPDYITKYMYMPFSWNVNNYVVPFVMVRVTQSRASVFVGYNLGLGYNEKNGAYRVCSLNPTYVSEIYNISYSSVCYYATFNPSTYEITADWRQLEAVDWGDSGAIVSYGSNIVYSYTENDYYFYGGAGVRPRADNVASAAFTMYESGENCYFQCDPSVGYQSGNFFYHQSSTDLKPYGQYFVPPSASAQQSQLQEEEVKTSKGIWETLKSIPDMIAEKFKSLFIPEEGYFDSLTTEFKNFFSERLGVIYELPEAVITILEQLIEFEPLSDGYYIPIPEVSIPIRLEDGSIQNFRIFEAQDYRFDFLSEGAFGTLYSFYRAFCWLTCIFGLISLAIRTYTDITDE